MLAVVLVHVNAGFEFELASAMFQWIISATALCSSIPFFHELLILYV